MFNCVWQSVRIFDRIVELDQQAFNLTREEAEGMTRMYKEELAQRLYMIEYEEKPLERFV